VLDLASMPLDLWLSQGVFAVLFVWLLMDTRKESRNREDRLNKQIDNQNQVQNKIAQTLNRMEIKISNITKKGEDK